MVAPLIYTVCDQAYFDTHAQAFRRSAESHGNNVWINLVRPNDHADWVKQLPPHDRKTFYVMLRFLLLPEVLRHCRGVLVMDIDSIFNEKIEFPDEYDMGIFFRPWARLPALKVLCSATYFTPRAIPFLERIRDRLIASSGEWGCDQAAIWQQTVEDEGKYRILHLDQSFISFGKYDGAPIWTAKGPRKFDPSYLKRKQTYEVAA